jgi:hypothetical protein
MADKVPVYGFKVYDVSTDRSDLRPVKGMIEAIKAANGVVVEGTEEMVDRSLLDSAGFCRPAILPEGKTPWRVRSITGGGTLSHNAMPYPTHEAAMLEAERLLGIGAKNIWIIDPNGRETEIKSYS